MRLVLAAAIGWGVAGLLYQTTPCRYGESLLSAQCFPESLEVLIAIALAGAAPWLTLRAAASLKQRVKSEEYTPRRAIGRYAIAALAAFGVVFVVGFAAVIVSRWLGLGFFSGESAVRVVMIVVFALAWGIFSAPVMFLIFRQARAG